MSITSLLFPFMAIVLWAGNVIVSKLAASAISPTAITFYRLILALALMSPVVLRPLLRNWASVRPHLGKMAISGLLAMALFQSLSYRAAESTTATNMAIVTALVPLLTAILSVIVLGEALTVGMAVGGVLSFVGLLYLVGQGDIAAIAHNGAESFKHARHVVAAFAASGRAGLPGLPVYRLPSTSPAHASWRFDRKLDAWRDVFARHGLA